MITPACAPAFWTGGVVAVVGYVLMMGAAMLFVFLNSAAPEPEPAGDGQEVGQ